jgi:hypothetical protein
MILEIFSVAVNNNCTVRYKDIHLKLVLLQFNCILGFLISYWYLWKKKNTLFFIVIFYFYFYVLFLCLCIRHRQDNFETESRAHKTSDCSFFSFFSFFFFFLAFSNEPSPTNFLGARTRKCNVVKWKENKKQKLFFVDDLFLYLFLELIFGWQAPWNVLVTNLSK